MSSMLRSVFLVACLSAMACGKDPPPGPTLTCPTAQELVHGRKLAPRSLTAYAIAAKQCVTDKWDQKAIRCIRDAKDVDAEDHCYAILLSPSQRDGLANALAVLDAPAEPDAGTPPATTDVPGLALVEKNGTYALHSEWLDVTLPGKPSLVQSTNDDGAATVASSSDGASEFTVIVHSIPSGMIYDAGVAITASRDEALKSAHVTLVSDEAGELGGLPGRKVVGKGGNTKAPVKLEARFTYDEAHRALIVATAVTRGASIDPRAEQMFDSLVLGAAGK